MTHHIRSSRGSLLLWSLLLVAPALAGEGRIPVYQAPTLISAPGRYVLTRNLPTTAGPAIQIDPGAGAVEIDLNGFTCGAIQAYGGVETLVIRNGAVTGAADWWFAIDAFGVNAVVIENVVVRTAGMGGIRALGAASAVLRNNTVIGPFSYDAIQVSGSELMTSGVVEKNVVRGPARTGISVQYADAFLVRDNQIDGCGFLTDSPGSLFVGDCASCRIEGNTVSRAVYGAFTLEGVTGAIVSGNTAREAGGQGFTVSGTSEHCRLSDNVSSRNFDAGFKIFSSSVHLERNLAEGNRASGVHIFGATGVSYRGNTFRGNGTAGPSGPCVSTPAACSTVEICDDGILNTSGGDNMAPSPGC